MKKIFIAALALLMMNGAMAQDIRIGVKVGGNLSTLTNYDDWVKTKMKFGFHAGAFLEFKFNERLSLQPEFLYSTQGIDFSIDDGGGMIITGSHSLSYINVPVLLKINLPEIAKGLSAEIGTQIGFSVSDKYTQKWDGGSRSESFKKLRNLIDVTAAIGLSYSFAENFVMSARYGLGLTKIFKTNRGGIIGEYKNSVIQLSVGYKF